MEHRGVEHIDRKWNTKDVGRIWSGTYMELGTHGVRHTRSETHAESDTRGVRYMRGQTHAEWDVGLGQTSSGTHTGLDIEVVHTRDIK